MSKPASPIELRPEDDISTLVARFCAELREPDKPFGLLVQFGAKDRASGDIASAFAQARLQTLREPGCIAFELSRQAGDTARFVVYERWRDVASFEAHLRRPYTVALRRTFEELIVGTPRFEVLLPADGQ